MQLTKETIQLLFSPLGTYSDLAIAVSGGPDSVALMWALQEWCSTGHPGQSITVFCVDHGLRDESAKEAEQVKSWALEAGFKAEILKWDGEKPAANIQAAARDARYALIIERMRALKIEALVMAHHLDDQAETFLLRLMRGSGLKGLSSMRTVTKRAGITLIRPFLDIRKSALITYLEAGGHRYFNDPSNQDDRYDRVQIRALMGGAFGDLILPERLCETAKHLQRADDVIDAEVVTLKNACLTAGPVGSLLLDHNALLNAPREVGLRLLSELFHALSGADYPPRFEKIERILGLLATDDSQSHKTSLGGYLIERQKDHTLIYRESARISTSALKIHPGDTVIWDNRYSISLDADFSEEITVDALFQHIEALRAEGSSLKKKLSMHRRALLDSLPVLYTSLEKIAVPALDHWPDMDLRDRVKIEALDLEHCRQEFT